MHSPSTDSLAVAAELGVATPKVAGGTLAVHVTLPVLVSSRGKMDRVLVTMEPRPSGSGLGEGWVVWYMVIKVVGRPLWVHVILGAGSPTATHLYCT